MHLRPKIYNQDLQTENTELIIEDSNFKEVKFDSSKLEEKLDSKNLKITYVILEMPNCKTLAYWFKTKLGADEVFFFEVSKKTKAEDEQTNQILNDQVDEFMQNFIIEFY